MNFGNTKLSEIQGVKRMMLVESFYYYLEDVVEEFGIDMKEIKDVPMPKTHARYTGKLLDMLGDSTLLELITRIEKIGKDNLVRDIKDLIESLEKESQSSEV